MQAYSPEEFRATPLLKALDSNQNGTLEAPEWINSFDHQFKIFDKNKDGQIDKSEKQQLTHKN